MLKKQYMAVSFAAIICVATGQAKAASTGAQFLKIDTVTLGLPRLRAGKYAEYRGMRPPFDGFYYVEKSEHTYGDDGLRTHFTARRPGMPFRPTAGGT